MPENDNCRGLAVIPATENSRRTRRTRTAATLLALAGAALVLSGCALSRGTPTVTYDLGPSAALAGTAGNAASAAPAPLPRLRVSQTDGPDWLEGNALYYRLLYAQAQRLQPYATQRWVMSPTRLFDERLRESVSARGGLAWSGDTSVPGLKVDLLAFEQVFDSATTSQGVVRLRATVFHRGQLGQQTFEVRRPAPSADGAGGVRALAEASDAAIAALLDWTATLPLK
ncbi:ABC-type transport auxiliary lipoprotein family protein [Cupriavidus consociatus]|uniref:ABC-type transport auxiliary lipoprotein family protein n=1 Tax=Cupriavidus consociatus TaxID=2821357 RepID=UPI001AE63D8E|nr:MULTISPECIES: ABC-type transport auxiliary lipoprotein family protein [unclassified Cupriavidus]MBP0622059.1 membrane integrity-associated transporter subunit PqiC [Cupriavidus sp. LEh25]MDK2658735.1 ABC-type transport auxiliary lipoprotein family protein [Cupriavidus sp. LEh21]